MDTWTLAKFVTPEGIWFGEVLRAAASHGRIGHAAPRPPGPLNMNDLSPPFRTRGRAARDVSACTVRELDEGDLALLAHEKGSTAPALKRLGERHHALARALASGMTEAAAAITCGYSGSRVSILKDDPAFRELLAFYRDDVTDKYLDMHGVLAGLSVDAAMELRVRLEDDMEADEKKLSVGQLVELTKLGADRTGFGPQTSALNINANINLAGRLQAARERVRARIEGPVHDSQD